MTSIDELCATADAVTKAAAAAGVSLSSVIELDRDLASERHVFETGVLDHLDEPFFAEVAIWTRAANNGAHTDEERARHVEALRARIPGSYTVTDERGSTVVFGMLQGCSFSIRCGRTGEVS